MTTLKTYNATQTAKFVRKELKGSFPHIKFSVTSSHHEVRVSWLNGPTIKQVDNVTRKFGGMTFDGMDDSTKYSKSNIEGEAVQFYCYRPSTKRNLSLDFAQKLVAHVQEKHPGMSCLEVKVSDFSGFAYFDRMSSHLTFDQENYFMEAINSISEEELSRALVKDAWQIDLQEFLRDREYLASQQDQVSSKTNNLRHLFVVK